MTSLGRRAMVPGGATDTGGDRHARDIDDAGVRARAGRFRARSVRWSRVASACRSSAYGDQRDRVRRARGLDAGCADRGRCRHPRACGHRCRQTGAGAALASLRGTAAVRCRSGRPSVVDRHRGRALPQAYAEGCGRRCSADCGQGLAAAAALVTGVIAATRVGDLMLASCWPGSGTRVRPDRQGPRPAGPRMPVAPTSCAPGPGSAGWNAVSSFCSCCSASSTPSAS